MAGPEDTVNLDINAKYENALRGIKEVTDALTKGVRLSADMKRQFGELNKTIAFIGKNKDILKAINMGGLTGVSETGNANIARNAILKGFQNQLRAETQSLTAAMVNTMRSMQRQMARAQQQFDAMGERALSTLSGQRRVTQGYVAADSLNAQKAFAANPAIIQQEENINRLKAMQALQEQKLALYRKNSWFISKDDLAIQDQLNRRIQQRTVEEQRLSRLQKLRTSTQYDSEISRAQGEGSMQNTLSRLNSFGGMGLVAIQARLMLNYKLLNDFYSSMTFMGNFVVELDQELRNLQAITATTNTEMDGLRETLIKVSEATKFTAVEVTRASVVLGQAGFSTEEIRQSIMSITLLATATGSDLTNSVNLVTTAIEVFNMQASQAAHVANAFTTAVNETKVDMDKLSMGFQYAGNIAAQTGANFDELTAAIAAMANAGVRRGSILGTGLRTLMSDLLKPTKAFKEQLDLVGLSMSDVDIETNGFLGVVKNLQEAGFGAANAVKAFEKRGATAFMSLSSQADTLNDLLRTIVTSSSAAKANATQMEGLTNTYKKFQSAAGALASQMGAGIVALLQKVTNALADMFTEMRGGKTTLTVIGTLMTSFAAAIPVAVVVSMVKHLGVLAGILPQITKGLVGLQLAAAASGTVLARLGGLLTFFTSPLGIIAGLIAIGGAFAYFGSQARKASDELDKAQASVDSSKGAMETRASRLESLGSTLDMLLSRSERLKNNQGELATEVVRAKESFGTLGDALSGNITTFDDLIERIRKLREDELQKLPGDIADLIKKLELLQIKQEDQAKSMTGSNLLRSSGLEQVSNVMGMDTSKRDVRSSFDPAKYQKNFLANVPAEVQSIVSRLKNFSVSLSGKPEDVQTAIDNMRTLRGDALEAAVKLSKMGDNGLRFAENVETAAKKLEEWIGQANEKLQNQRSQERLKEEGRLASFTNHPAVKEAVRIAQDSNMEYLHTYKPSFEKEKTLEGLKALVDGYQGFAKGVSEQIAGFLREAGMSESDIKAAMGTQAFSAIKTFNDHIAQAGVEGAAKIAEETIDQLKISIESDKLEVRALRSRLDLIPEKDLQNLRETISNRLRKIATDEIRLYALNVKHKGEKDDVALKAKEVNQTLDESQRELNEQVAEKVRKFVELRRPIITFFDMLDEALDQIKKGLEEVTRQLEEPMKRFRQRMDAVGYRINKFRVSSVQQEQMSRQEDPIRLQQLRGTVSANKSAIFDYTAELQMVQAGRTLQQEKYNAAVAGREKLLSTKDASEPQMKAAREAEQRELDLLVKYKKEERDIQNEINKLTWDTADAEAEIVARTEPMREDSLTTNVQNALTQWQEANGYMDTATKRVTESIKGALDSTREGMSSFLYDMATKTTSVADAFRSMATSILQSMARIASNKLAESLMGWGIDLATSFMSNGLTSSGVNTGSLLDGKAGGGLVVGGIPGKDSVPTMLMPDEYVLRKSAVDAIGVDTLNQLNSTGNLMVKKASSSAASGSARAPSSGPQALNLWMVSPDQVPPPSESDIIMTVAKNISSKGVVRQLIRTVALQGA